MLVIRIGIINKDGMETRARGNKIFLHLSQVCSWELEDDSVKEKA